MVSQVPGENAKDADYQNNTWVTERYNVKEGTHDSSANYGFYMYYLGTEGSYTVDVDYVTSDGTAIAGSDYTATSGTLTIISGTSSGTINVPITGDTTIEGDKTFTLTLSNPANATLGSPAMATGTITNDDTRPLNDTGIVTCAGPSSNVLPCPYTHASRDYPGQDGDYGRDFTVNDDTDGHAGFSFTKLDSSGSVLPASATSWSCVQDNVTGLVWEVKSSGGLRGYNQRYSWYNSTGVNDGGDPGTSNGGSCSDTGNCDTEKFVAAVNTVGLCGASDWRLPSAHELLSIVDNSERDWLQPTIDWSYIPFVTDDNYWTSDTVSTLSANAWDVWFRNGALYGNSSKSNMLHVLLVRSSQ